MSYLCHISTLYISYIYPIHNRYISLSTFYTPRYHILYPIYKSYIYPIYPRKLSISTKKSYRKHIAYPIIIDRFHRMLATVEFATIEHAFSKHMLTREARIVSEC